MAYFGADPLGFPGSSILLLQWKQSGLSLTFVPGKYVRKKYKNKKDKSESFELPRKRCPPSLMVSVLTSFFFCLLGLQYTV